MTEDGPVLEARNLEKYFAQSDGLLDGWFGTKRHVQAVDGVSFDLSANEVKGVIGESGCGKTTLLHAMMGLTETTGGEIRYRGRPVSEFDRADWKAFRRNVQIVFQDPFNSLDPKMTVEESLREPLKIHNVGDQDERVHNALRRAELNPPEEYLRKLPKHLSGGEKQRVSIARALVLDPDVILADEPVSMLDVSTQAAVLKLLSRLTRETGTAMLYISHDLSTVSYVCDEVNVMYLGRIVETAPTKDLISDPKHPYSQALINAVPVPDPYHARERTRIEAQAPDPVDIGEGCRFRDRCPDRMDVCERTPMNVEMEDDRQVACHLYYDHDAVAEDADPRGQIQRAGGD